MQQILQEVVKMKDFKHCHVMPLIGVCLDSGVGVVMPFMANGSILTYLKKERGKLLLNEDAEIEQVLPFKSCVILFFPFPDCSSPQAAHEDVSGSS